MPDLFHTLQQRHDIGYLRIVAGLWGVELDSPEADEAARELSAALLDPALIAETLDILSTEARAALEALVAVGGKIAWAAFARRFGEIREIGPGQRDREQVYRHPISPAEALFYRALLARAFFDTASGAQEFAYVPEDLLALIPAEAKRILPPLGRLAIPKERARLLHATDRLLDDATTLLAALRMGLEPPRTGVPVQVIRSLFEAAGIIVKGAPQAEAVRKFLEAPRAEALAMLAEAWQSSASINDLRLIPEIRCEGEWANQPLAARQFLLNLLSAVPPEKWWSLPAFVHDVKAKYPDFQRPVGDYDSWFIQRALDGTYLRGFASWDEVDGALIRYLITGPLFWLGKVDLATLQDSETISAFRLRENPAVSAEEAKLTVASTGLISAPRLAPRVVRYVIARFCDWEEEKYEEYRYRVGIRSLERAGKQGLKVSQLLSLLAKNSAAEIPPAFVKALKRWDAQGTEARVEQQTILRLSRPEVLAELRKSRAARFLGESLGPVTVVVKPGAQARVQAALAELGMMVEDTIQNQSTVSD